MKSTGEVIGLDTDYAIAFAKSQLGSGTRVPTGGTVFISVRDEDKPRILGSVRALVDIGFRVIATSGTQRWFEAQGVPATKINKVLEGRPHVVVLIKNGQIVYIVNTTEGKQAIADSFSIRREALMRKVSYTTTLAAARATCQALRELDNGTVNCLQDLHRELHA